MTACLVGVAVGLSSAGCGANTYIVLPPEAAPSSTTSAAAPTATATSLPPDELLNGVYRTMVGSIEAQWTMNSTCAAAGCTATVTSTNGGWTGNATLTGNQWDITVVRPDGKSCQNGTSGPSTNHYSWDAVTLKGTVDSSWAAVCDGEPAGTYNADFAILTPPVSTSAG